MLGLGSIVVPTPPPASGQPYPCAPGALGMCTASSIVYQAMPAAGWPLSAYGLPCDAVSTGQNTMGCAEVPIPNSQNYENAPVVWTSPSTGQSYCGPGSEIPVAPCASSSSSSSGSSGSSTSTLGFSDGLALWETPSTAFSALGSLSFASANLAYTMGVLLPPLAAVGLLLMMMNGGKR
jgi:hypothetical protein